MLYTNWFHNLNTLNLKTGKEHENLYQQWFHCSLAPVTWVQAEEGLPGPEPSLQRTPKNIQRCRWVWDLKKPPTVDCTLGSLQTTLHFLKQKSRLHLFTYHIRSPEPVLLPVPQRRSSEFFKSSPYFYCPLFPALCCVFDKQVFYFNKRRRIPL